MYRNYIKIAIRNLLKHRVHSGINLLGLAIGLAGTILIALWIQRELSMNTFHENSARVFRILEHQTYGVDIMTFGATPGPLARVLEEYPDIEVACRSTWDNRTLLGVDDQTYYEYTKGVEPSFLDIFSFPLIHGDKETALSKPDNIVITRSLAEKLFGKTDVVGETVTIQNQTERVVTAVLEDLPSTSQMRFTLLYPFQNYYDDNEWLQQWGNNGIITYFMTTEPMLSEVITPKIENTIIDNSEVEHTRLHALALPDWYLRWDFEDGIQTGGGRIENVRLFGMIAFFILLIACINFMNLSTAKSANRAMEVGVRKVSGANRSAVAGQFFMESMITVLLAGFLGMALASMVLPQFNNLFNLELSLGDAGGLFYLGVVGVIFLAGILAGSYPAFFLSRFEPVRVLKGQIKTGRSAVRLRKVLVTAQFVISTALIVSSLVIFRQIEFIKNKNLGYDKENLMYVPANGDLFDNYEALKNELKQTRGVSQVSTTNAEIHYWGNNSAGIEWAGKDPEVDILFDIIPCGIDFVETIGAEILDGRDFSSAFPADSTNFLINETAAKLMGFDNPVGEKLTMWGEVEGNVVGLLKDFQVGTMRQEQSPSILILRPWMNYIYLRIEPNGQLEETLSSVEAVFNKHNPAYPFEYFFTDEEYEQLHRTEILTGTLAKIFAFLAIFVSCLGLFGLAAFATEQRRKEIGIRKVLGATTLSLTTLVSKDFLLLVLLAMVFAIPISWWAMSDWLQDFAYGIDLSWGFFAVAGLLAAIVAFLTVATQSIKAALANPVDSLRSE